LIVSRRGPALSFDLCAKVSEMGINVFKIMPDEKTPRSVYTVHHVYRREVDECHLHMQRRVIDFEFIPNVYGLQTIELGAILYLNLVFVLAQPGL